MLFTDSDVVTLADLQTKDSEVPSVASLSDPAIPVEGAGSAIRDAWSEAKNKILAGQQIYGSSYGVPPGSSAALQAIMYGVPPGAIRSRIFAEQIVVDDGLANSSSALKDWLVYDTLHRFYTNASERFVKEDRFAMKAERYGKSACGAWSRFSRIGLSIIRQPLSAPGALHDSKAMGTVFDLVTSVSGESGSGMDADVAITWVNGNAYVSPVQPNKGESGPSARVTFTIPVNSLLNVSIADLIPPDGTSPYDAFADGILAPLAATHWNVYAGVTGGTLFLQNSTPIPLGTETWSGYPVLSGFRASTGQVRDIRLPFRNLFHRA